MIYSTKTNLTGNSNESLILSQNEHGASVVTKFFLQDFERVEASIAKHIGFKTVLTQDICLRSCKAELTLNGESLELKMPFVAGLVGKDFAFNGNARAADNLRQILQAFLKRSLKEAQHVPFNRQKYLRKIDEIKRVSTINIEPYTTIAENLVLGNDECDLHGYCHGDLTLSNIICESDKSFVLIDFLKTYHESPLQDLAKINQERKFGWSLRGLNKAAINRGMIFFDKALPEPKNMISKSLLTTYLINEMLTLLRIAPYVSDRTTETWLTTSLKHYRGILG